MAAVRQIVIVVAQDARVPSTAAAVEAPIVPPARSNAIAGHHAIVHKNVPMPRIPVMVEQPVDAVGMTVNARTTAAVEEPRPVGDIVLIVSVTDSYAGVWTGVIMEVASLVVARHVTVLVVVDMDALACQYVFGSVWVRRNADVVIAGAFIRIKGT